MQSVGILGRFISLLILAVLMMCLPLVAHADYLVGAGPVYIPAAEFAEPVVCSPCCQRAHRHHYKKHHVVRHKKHYRHHRYSYAYPEPVCSYRYHPQHEPVVFVAGSPSGRGGYVNLLDCAPYDPDMSTGDDDPTIYPGMNIDN